MAEVQNQTFRDLHKGFVDELTEKGRSESTVIAYAKDIEQLLNFLSSKGTTGIDSITIDDLESFKTDLQENNYTPKVFLERSIVLVLSTSTCWRVERSMIIPLKSSHTQNLM